MHTTDGIVYIHHEADWSSTALVSWKSGTDDPHEVAVQAPLLWSDNPDGGSTGLPVHIEVRAVRLATRGRMKWEHDLVLSRPVPGRMMMPWATHRQEWHDPTDGWLFDSSLSTESSHGLRVARRGIPLGWVEHVAIAMHANGRRNGQFGGSTAVLIDIGAPHRDLCTCGRPLLHEKDCPQFDTFPRIGRLAINLARVDKFIETLNTARTTVERTFVP